MGGMVGFGVVGSGGGGHVGGGGGGGQQQHLYVQRGVNSLPLLSAPQRTHEAWQQHQHGSSAIPSRDSRGEEFIKENEMIMEIPTEGKEEDEKKKGVLGLGLPTNTCQDCGNQAKKDCAHMRCRTCCKTRGFDCPTHVKSTWVPASRRRERQQEEGPRRNTVNKRQRSVAFVAPPNATLSHTTTSTAAPHPPTSDINSTRPVPNIKGNLPAEVRAQTAFKCVRVTAIEDGADEYAYQATVKIGGHIFKGVLYDRGLDTKTGPLNFPDHQLGGRNVASTTALIDPAQIYGTSDSAFLGGIKYIKPVS
eukprot:Gb_21716 [translate_table: standard]